MIDVRDVTFSYAGAAAPAVRDLAFAVAPGEVFGFLGPSGAGKSTTQKILIGLLRGYQGAITVLGRDLAGWGAEYYERIGVSFELPNHFQKLTALENLRYFAALYRGPVREPRELLAEVGLEDAAGLAVGQFSKGMKNRLNLARALLHNPELLFLDEPTSGLDPANARRVRELIRGQQRAGRTIVLTTHNMAVAEELCDRVAFIMDGRIALIDTPRALMLRYGEPLVQVEARGERRAFPLAGLGENGEFLGILRAGSVQTIHSQEATLEDVFIRVTGRSLV